MFNIKKYFLKENVGQVAFQSIISIGIICNEYYILCQGPEPRDSAGNC